MRSSGRCSADAKRRCVLQLEAINLQDANLFFMSKIDEHIQNLKEKRKVTFPEDIDFGPLQNRWYCTSGIKEVEKKYGLTCRRGAFTATETNNIRKYVSEYLEENKVDFSFLEDILVNRRYGPGSVLGNFFVHISMIKECP